LILGADLDHALAAAESAVNAMRNRSGVALPFPGGVVRSGSKVGARGYPGMVASTNDAYCPTLKPVTSSALPDEVNAVLEIVVDGLTSDAVADAMRAGILAACGPGVIAVSAGNYGGGLGPYHFRLRDILAGATT
jgi:formylmethanofuran--tetrahydromethanopterin N-formyltransferase